MPDEPVTDDPVAPPHDTATPPHDTAMPPDEDVSSRAELLPEERVAGSDDPDAQADAILTESEERTASRNAAPSTHLEHRTSDQVTDEPS